MSMVRIIGSRSSSSLVQGAEISSEPKDPENIDCAQRHSDHQHLWFSSEGSEEEESADTVDDKQVRPSLSPPELLLLLVGCIHHCPFAGCTVPHRLHVRASTLPKNLSKIGGRSFTRLSMRFSAR